MKYLKRVPKAFRIFFLVLFSNKVSIVAFRKKIQKVGDATAKLNFKK